MHPVREDSDRKMATRVEVDNWCSRLRQADLTTNPLKK
jgi:hypothetical protein